MTSVRLPIGEELHQLRTGLDLNDADDRARFRQRVSDRYQYDKPSAIRDDVRELEHEIREVLPGLGSERLGHSRADALRALTGVYLRACGLEV